MEEWRAITGFEGLYEVSSLGRVRTVARISMHRSRHGGTRTYPHRSVVLKSSTTGKRGYYVVCLQNNDTRVSRRIARLVAEAFHGPSQGRQVNHIDGVKANNTAANLEWVTCTENIRHALRTGLRILKRGTDVASSKLTEDKVREIRRLRLTQTRSEIASRYGVTPTTVSSICKRKSWAHVA